MKDIKDIIGDASDMLLHLSSTAKRNQNFDMGYTEKELSDKSRELMDYLRELYKK